MRLNISKLAAEKLTSSLDSYIFNYIYILTTAIITLARKSLGIFISKHRAHCSHNLRGHKIFGSDKLNVFSLSLQLECHCIGNLAVGFCNFCY